MILSIELPFSPSANTYYRRAGHHIHISDKGRAFARDVAAVCHAIGATKRVTDRLQVSVTLHAPNRRKIDIDNRIKALLDALTKAGVYADDEQIDLLIVRRGEIRAGGACFVEVCTMVA